MISRRKMLGWLGLAAAAPVALKLAEPAAAIPTSPVPLPLDTLFAEVEDGSWIAWDEALQVDPRTITAVARFSKEVRREYVRKNLFHPDVIDVADVTDANGNPVEYYHRG